MSQTTHTPVALELLIPDFPWAVMYDELGFHMPYPEVMMTSDRAYALSTQINGLLMMQSWELDNVASYHLARVEEATHEAYRLSLSLSLGTIDEAWEYIGIPTDQLLRYMRLSLLGHVLRTQLSGKSYRTVELPDDVYMLIAEA